MDKDDLYSSRKYRYGRDTDEDRYYTQRFSSRCPIDASQVVHTVRFQKATCSRVDDLVDDFHCSRNSSCVRCLDNYR